MTSFIIKFTFWYFYEEIIIAGLMLYEKVNLDIMSLYVNCQSKSFIVDVILILVVNGKKVIIKDMTIKL